MSSRWPQPAAQRTALHWRTRPIAPIRDRALFGVRRIRIDTRASYVQSVHLSYGITSPGRGARRYDAVDFDEIVCCEHNVRGAHVLLEVLARFGTRYRYDEGSQLAIAWPMAQGSRASRSRRFFSTLAL